MMTNTWRLVLVAVLVLTVLGGVYALTTRTEQEPQPEPIVIAEPVPEPEPEPTQRVIGTSVEGRPIEVYSFGTGTTQLLFVGGVHGGYEWNSVALAYKMIDYFSAAPNIVPSSLRVSIIPNLNPDGVYVGVGLEGKFTDADVLTKETNGIGRMNARNVDLNRNFNCKWQPDAVWRGNPVSAGTAPFSEPEAAALRDFVLSERPAGVVFWHSQSNAVYASECETGILPGTRTLMNTYAQAAGYPSVDSFTAYAVTGDAEGWLASIGIPAVTVELSTHQTIEWEKNLAGVQAILRSYTNTGL